jgi:C4-dicarboxylate-specific signal transduction histidine kinase
MTNTLHDWTTRLGLGPPRTVLWRIIIFVGLGCTLAGAAALLHGERALRLEAQERERVEFALLAAVSDGVLQNLNRTLEWVEHLQDLTAKAWLARPHDFDPTVAEHLQRVARDARVPIYQVTVIDAAGLTVWSTTPGAPRVSLEDRPHFLVHRDSGAERAISKPLIGRLTGRRAIQFTRAIRNSTEAFAGVVVVSVDPVDLSRELAGAISVPGVAATLLREDATILARTIDLEDQIGQLQPGPVAASVLGMNSGEARVFCSIMLRDLLTVWRRAPSNPLALMVWQDTTPLDRDAAAARTELRLKVGGAAVLLWGMLVSTGALLERGRAAEKAALAEANRRHLEDLLDALPAAIYRAEMGPEGELRQIHFSRGLSGLTTRPPREFMDTRSNVTLGGKLIAKFDAVVVELLARGGCTIEYFVDGQGDQCQWIREQCQVLQVHATDRLEVVGIISDITEERRLKAKALANSKLATLGEMATGVAHELNQPCASIVLAADTAALELASHTQEDLVTVAERLDAIAEQAMRLRRIIDQFRIFGRSEEGAIETLDIKSAVASALQICGGTLHTAGVRVSVRIAPEIPSVIGPRTAFEHVLVNLLVNARDAMRNVELADRHIVIEGRHDMHSMHVVLAVRDYGIGLAPDAKLRVFEPFYTTKPIGEGTGLGLAVAYGTISSMNGSIDIDNAPGGGAVVSICLPSTLPEHCAVRSRPTTSEMPS